MQPDPKEFAAGDYNLYRYCHNDPVNKSDPLGLDTYSQNRDFDFLGGTAAYASNYLKDTHTFVFTTHPDGSKAHTYSWGNAENKRGWNMDTKTDLKAADQAIKMPRIFQSKVADSKLDPYIQKAYDMLNKPENEHDNGVINNNCKTEAAKLISLARDLQRAADQAAKEAKARKPADR
jgi:hypothetical protein